MTLLSCASFSFPLESCSFPFDFPLLVCLSADFDEFAVASDVVFNGVGLREVVRDGRTEDDLVGILNVHGVQMRKATRETQTQSSNQPRKQNE